MSWQVGTNGLLSFNFAYNPFSNEVFPGGSDTSSRYLAAPFWDDTDISSDEVGEISYEIHESGYYLEQVTDFLRRKRPSSFIGTWMLVAYWDSVRPFPGSSSTAVSARIVSHVISLFEVCELITAILTILPPGELIPSNPDHRWDKFLQYIHIRLQ